MTPRDIVRAALPGATDAVCEHVIWGMTPFPFHVDPQQIYRAADRWRRAVKNGIWLCDCCPNQVEKGQFLCQSCRGALQDAAKAS